jgi:hypothetical protein
MLITSRAAVEYRAMFDLTAGELAAVSVLDCCAGGSSLTAETPGRAVAVDPAYALGFAGLADRIRAALADGDRMIDENSDRFEWSWYGAPQRRAALRTAAAETFLTDVVARPGRYLAGALPRLPLADDSVDLVLSSHLLFTWSNQLDAEWHRRALDDLVRVARREVRVYPLVVQGSGAPVPFLDTVRAELHAAGHRTELAPVPYRFQRGAEHMLLVHA